MGQSAMVFESIAGGLLKATLPKVAGAIAAAVKNKLHPTELQRSLAVGLRESGAFDKGQKANNRVFYHWEPGRRDKFLIALLEHPDLQRELQKPLEQEGTPDVEILVQAARQVATTHNLEIEPAPLELWLKAFANAYFDEITAIRFQVAKADYLEQLANWFDDVKFAGVAVPGQDVERAERLAQIFVMPDVEEEARRGWSGEGLRGWGDEGVTDDRQSQLLQEQRLRSQLERSGRKFSARQLLNQHQKKIVLLGAPGSGKTTLMSFFAVTLAEQQGATAIVNDTHTEGLDRNAEGTDRDRSRMVPDAEGIDRNAEGLDRDRSQMQRDRSQMYPDAEGLRLDTLVLQTDADALPLPILIRIRDWARTPDVTLPEYARQFAETTMSCKPLPKGFFKYWLNNGRVLILLDGLDEVAEEAKRYHLVQCIENFLGQYPQNRAIITSRPAGYKRDFFRTEEFPHYELQPFDDGKIEEFCDRWYRSRVQDTAEALRRKESLQKALNQQDRIKLLARNPLLLTIIALIHRYQARLPRERYKLYDKAVETLLTAWDDNKELSNQTVLQYLQLDDLRRLMESLAYWIHTQGNTGDREGGTLIDKDELIQKLCQEIKTLKQLQHYEAKAEAERFVKFIRDRTGLLNEQGQDCYAFVHKTFQEYLAAQDINYQADNEDDFEIVLTHIEQHLHDPHWREVLLLLIAQQNPKKAARAIRKVLTANSPYEQWLHRDVLFAGRCLAEDPKGLKQADSQLLLKILDALIELEIKPKSQLGEQVYSQISPIFFSLEETAFESQALNLLKDKGNFIEQFRLLIYQAALGERQRAITCLLEMLKEREPRLRSQAAYTLSSIDNVPQKVIQALLVLLEDEDYDVRYSAESALENIRMASMPIHVITVHRYPPIFGDHDVWVRSEIAREFGNTGDASQEVVQKLLALLLGDPAPEVRSAAAEALGKLRHASESVIQALLQKLTDEDPRVRASAVNALGWLQDRRENVVEAVLARLDDEDFRVRSDAANALGWLGSDSNEIIQALLEKIADENSRVCSRAAEALSKLGYVSEEVTQALLSQVVDEDYWIRSDAEGALSELNISEVMIAALLSRLNDDASGVRSRATAAIGKLGKTSNQVEPAIVQWIEQHQDEDCVGAGIDALWEIVEGEG